MAIELEEPNSEEMEVEEKRMKLDPAIFKEEFVKDMAHFYAIKEFGQHF